MESVAVEVRRRAQTARQELMARLRAEIVVANRAFDLQERKCE
jgi:hypothetical protein